MTRKDFLEYCLLTYGTTPDYPFENDLETAVLRHTSNRKWYAIVMKVPRRKFGLDSDERINVVNLKLPSELFGSFDRADGVYPAYHMNKHHWISVLLPDAPNDVVEFLVNASHEATRPVTKKRETFRSFSLFLFPHIGNKGFPSVPIPLFRFINRNHL